MERGERWLESHARTLLRSVTWRLVAFVVATTLSWVVTRDLSSALKIGLAYNAVQLLLHYLHDRVWARVSWGLAPPQGSTAEPGRAARAVDFPD